jgi:hypothetical protein
MVFLLGEGSTRVLVVDNFILLSCTIYLVNVKSLYALPSPPNSKLVCEKLVSVSSSTISLAQAAVRPKLRFHI